MTTKLLASQGQGPVDSVDNWVSESCSRGEKEATRSRRSSLQNRAAPKAEPEEDVDVDVLEPEAQVAAPQENQKLSANNIIQVTKKDSQESTVISHCALGESQEVVTELEQAPQKLSSQLQAQEGPEEPVDVCEDALPPPPPSHSVLTPHKSCETEAFSSTEGEAGEWSSDTEAISDPAEDIKSLDGQSNQEWTKTPQPTEPVIRGANTMSAETMADDVAAQENDTRLNFLPDGIGIRQTENNMSPAAHHFPPDSNKSDDINTASSPPFADESEEEEEVIDIMSCQNRLNTTDISREDFQQTCSCKRAPNSAQQTNPSAEQQEELLSRGHPELAPRGENQETAQQVFGQRSPPLSAVAMEPSNEGGAASHGSQCVVAVRERRSRAGERTEEENEQAGGEEGQKHGEPGGKEPAGQPHGKGLLRYSQTVRIQKLHKKKLACGEGRGRHTRMETDSWDESHSDSGVSADFSPGSTMEGSPASASTETPIEREIRRSVERENSLRKSRGLPNSTSNSQYVKIPSRKAVGTQSHAGKTEKYQGKDREFAGKMMQQDIYEETQREQDLVKLGKIPGVYDKGTVRQLKERKQIFEAFQTPSESVGPARNKTLSWSSAADVSSVDNQEKMASQASTAKSPYLELNRSLEVRSSTQSSISAKAGDSTDSPSRGPGFTEGKGFQVVIIENNMDVPADKWYSAKPVAVSPIDSGMPYISHPSVGEEEEEEEELTPQENPFFKLRSSTNLVKVQQDIQETHEREKELRKQRRSLYGDRGGAKGGEAAAAGGGGGGGRSDSVDGRSFTLSPSLNGQAAPDLPRSSTREETGLSAAHQSVSKFRLKPPAQAEDNTINRPEGLSTPRSPRQKTPLVQRWESGLVNGHNEEDD
ncbi:unnamed protein product [Ophioblennius macclurei]